MQHASLPCNNAGSHMHCMGAVRHATGCLGAPWPFGCVMGLSCHAQAGCREAVLAYLWALVGVNEGRTAGGEKGVLKEQATSAGPCLCIACSLAHGALQLRRLREAAICDMVYELVCCAMCKLFVPDKRLGVSCGLGAGMQIEVAKVPCTTELVAGCSDGLAVGTSALCLRFCRPFLGGEDKFMSRLDPAFYRQQAFRHAALPMIVHHCLITCARAFLGA